MILNQNRTIKARAVLLRGQALAQHDMNFAKLFLLKTSLKPGVMLSAFGVALGGRGRGNSEFQASQSYIVSTVSVNNNHKKPNHSY